MVNCTLRYRHPFEEVEVGAVVLSNKLISRSIASPTRLKFSELVLIKCKKIFWIKLEIDSKKTKSFSTKLKKIKIK